MCVRSGSQLWLLILISVVYRCLAREPALLLVLNANSATLPGRAVVNVIRKLWELVPEPQLIAN